jgi:Fanconi anemia group J protein
MINNNFTDILNQETKQDNINFSNKKIENKKITPFRIFFGSRTHAQITQVIRELKKTNYRPIMSVLGMRYL